MATKLDKDITRESSVIVSDREILISLTESQEVSMKLKGMKSGHVSIPINELYSQLAGTPVEKPKAREMVVIKNKEVVTASDGPMISLRDLRSHNAIADMDYETKVKFEAIIKTMMDNYEEKYGKYYQ